MTSRARFHQQLIRAGLAVIAVGVGVITAPSSPPTAWALPPAPPAACAQYAFNGPVTIKTTDNNAANDDLTIEFTGVGPQADTDATLTSAAISGPTRVRGSINDRGFVFLLVSATENSPSYTFAGNVGDGGIARGTYITPDLKTVPWQITAPLTCAAAAPSNPADTTATVVRDATEWDQPDGKGNAYKNDAGQDRFVAAHTQVQLVEPCRDDWCHVEVPGNGGIVWLYEKGYLTVP